MTKRPPLHTPLSLLLLLSGLSFEGLVQVYNTALLAGLLNCLDVHELSDREVSTVLSTSIVWG